MSNASNAVLALCRAFYGKRISDEEYNTLSGCRSLSELSSFLRGNELYASFFQNVHPNTPSIEEAIENSAFERFEKIFRYERAIGDKFYEYFIVRKEIDEILKITLMVFAGSPDKYIVNVSPYTARKVSIDLYEFAKVKSFNDILLLLSGTRYEKTYADLINQGELTYLKFEDAFEALFDTYILKLVKKCFSGAERKEVIDIIIRQKDMQLILRRLRICRYYPFMLENDKRISKDYPFSYFTGRQLDALYSARIEESLRDALRNTSYKDSADADDIERDLYLNLFSFIKKQFRFSSHPGTVTYCYLFLAENETSNLKMITEGIKYKISQEEIEKQLCF